LFNGKASKVREFVMAYKLYLRMRMREMIVEEQVQWVLIYVQEGVANVWKEIVIEDLDIRILEFETVGEFLEEIKKNFGEGVEELKKVAELKEVEQE